MNVQSANALLPLPFAASPVTAVEQGGLNEFLREDRSRGNIRFMGYSSRTRTVESRYGPSGKILQPPIPRGGLVDIWV
ncbi:MAG: hypothetical protein JRH13_09920 [Deltaproteobacteria bacterium]|nr:hypothetical protein [Deltaproteobacteria bacterium]MBW2129668.1 hypothetical protein [Deltaproteobacteria bacterium]MBW2304868.1 hypothetical protein [Deltaproteobacteria bacterium]